MTLDCEVKGFNGTVIIRLTPEEAALFANDCRSFCEVIGEDALKFELELRRLSDRAEGKI